MSSALSSADLIDLFVRFLALSLLSIGGAVSTAPEMHRYFVGERGWLSDTDFTASIALAQAAPGPNVLFVPLLGYQVAGAIGAAAALVGILLPSTLLSLAASRLGNRHRDSLPVRAFTAGFAPVTVGLIVATGWILAQPFLRDLQHGLGAVVLIALTVLAMLRTGLAPIWLIALGAAAGALGLV
ncbi:MAG: chromate transporter [Rhodocyclaceae bacterium]